MHIIIHAPNVHQGGGKTLLSGLLSACHEGHMTTAVLDARMDLPFSVQEKVEVRQVPPTLFHRLKAEWWLARNAEPSSVILCFGNLPPMFRLRARTYLFLQNRYLVESCKLTRFSAKVRVRVGLERFWLIWRSRNVDEFLVQSASMRAQTLMRLGSDRAVRVMPFAYAPDENDSSREPQLDAGVEFDFLYVASGEPHKNHRKLIESWRLLAQEDIFPILCLTLDREVSPDLCYWMDEQAARWDLKIRNIGHVSHSRINQLYRQSGAMIYPSDLESFGLPLIEAQRAGMPILAAERDYVRDLLDPVESFEPDSPISIARSVKRYMKIKESRPELLGAAQFVESLLSD